jgi:hypothetical protein
VWVRIDTGRDTRMEIEAVPGAYMCTEGASGHEVHYVDKTKCCTCGGTGDLRCEHIDAVARYLQSGGKRARALEPGEVPIACPLCGAGVQSRAGSPIWRCPADPAHYWQWRGEEGGVRAFLTGAHPAKAGAFYEQTSEERESFRDDAQTQMLRLGYAICP